VCARGSNRALLGGPSTSPLDGGGHSVTDLGDMLLRPPPFETLGALLDADESGRLSDEEFDDCLWLLVCRHVGSIEDAAGLPSRVVNYYASRRVEWDVGNGGFAQAAYNMYEWFPAAAEGYTALGLPEAAALIKRAYDLAQAERRVIGKLKRRRAGISSIFKSFRESSLAELDNQLVSHLNAVGWEALTPRLTYARLHRDAFRSLE
jgi:Domain of unknown function (DUF4375)